MNKIRTIDQAKELGEHLAKDQKRVVIAGGCFDILHVGHITFLENAKAENDILCVLLESDESIRSAKGPKRPINTQDDRAHVLAALSVVDYVIKLPMTMSNNDYDALVIAIKPAIIATTKGDTNRVHKERQANLIGAHVVDVVERIENQSTTKVFQILHEL